MSLMINMKYDANMMIFVKAGQNEDLLNLKKIYFLKRVLVKMREWLAG